MLIGRPQRILLLMGEGGFGVTATTIGIIRKRFSLFPHVRACFLLHLAARSVDFISQGKTSQGETSHDDFNDFVCRDYCSGCGANNHVPSPVLLTGSLAVANLPNELTRAVILNDVLARLGFARAAEAAETHVTPEPNKMGYADDGKPIVGVDTHHGKYRARIRYCVALSGADIRVTLIRTDCLEEAVWAYRYAHVALWGSASWASDDDILADVQLARK